MTILLYLVIILFSFGVLFIQTAPFGRLPSGRRRARIQASAQFRDGKFKNTEHTSVMADDVHGWEMMKYVLFSPNIRLKPASILPSEKHDIRTQTVADDSIVWFGHSSYMLRLAGKNILVDPVFSGSVSPLKFTNKSFAGSDVYTVADLPHIDVLILTHDHWDHLDYDTLRQLRHSVDRVVTSLGVGAHLERWGWNPAIIQEMDWWESVEIDAGSGLRLHCTPARHFSGRAVRRARTLWSSFVLETNSKRIFVGGDSGYGQHFAEIAKRFAPFDLAILECGQYDRHWKNIHMMPEQTIQAAMDLGSKRVIPVHWAKFTLSKHPWDEPILRVSAEAQRQNIELVTPRIGVPTPLFAGNTEAWWLGIQ